MNSSSECSICFHRYDSTRRLPKNLPCGHVKCMECLRHGELISRQQNCQFKCFECFKVVGDIDKLPTNFTILQEASSVAHQYHCDTCNKVKENSCDAKNHLFRSLYAHRSQLTQSSRKAVDTVSGVLEKVVPKVLQMRDIAEEQLHATMDAQSKATQLTQRLSAFINGVAGPGADQEAAMRDAGECSVRLPLLERGLRFLDLEKGTLRLEMQDAGETWAAKLDLSDGATLRPEVQAVAKFLMFLLAKEKCLQKQEKAAKDPKPHPAHRGPHAHPGAAAAGGGAQAEATRAPDQQGARGARHGNARWTITADGILDLSSTKLGEIPLGPAEKAAILKAQSKVTHLVANKCSEDQDFYTSLLAKHAPGLEKLELRQVCLQHLSLLGSMPLLTDLKIISYVGKVAVAVPPQASSVLRSLYVKLPTNVQMDLWEVYASSLCNIVMRVELSTLNIHNKLRALVAKTPNLRYLRLARFNNLEHQVTECAKQLAQIRGALPNSNVTVTCYTCN